jgi:hypothetical protein
MHEAAEEFIERKKDELLKRPATDPPSGPSE